MDLLFFFLVCVCFVCQNRSRRWSWSGNAAGSANKEGNRKTAALAGQRGCEEPPNKTEEGLVSAGISLRQTGSAAERTSAGLNICRCRQARSLDFHAGMPA